MKLKGLFHHVFDQVLAVNFRKTRDVKNEFFRVQRRDLSPQFFEAVDDFDFHSPEAGIISGI